MIFFLNFFLFYPRGDLFYVWGFKSGYNKCWIFIFELKISFACCLSFFGKINCKVQIYSFIQKLHLKFTLKTENFSNKFQGGYVFIEELFDTIFNMGCGLWVEKISHEREG